MTLRPPAASASSRALLVMGALLLLPTASSAQAIIRFGRGAASLELSASLTIPSRLTVSLLGAERVVGRTASYTEVELPVSVAANLAWTLTLAMGTTSALGPVLVHTVNGDWAELDTATPRAVVTGQDPTNSTEVRVQLRLPAGLTSTEPLRLRLSLVPAIGGGP